VFVTINAEMVRVSINLQFEITFENK